MSALFAKGSGLLRSAWLATLAATLVLSGCGHSSGSTAVGVGSGITLNSPSSTTEVEEGASLEITASVADDPQNLGVVWSLLGPGTASTNTKSTYVYVAPTGVTGSDTVTLTATSIANPLQQASVTLTVNGTLQLEPPVLFPANINVPYATFFTVDGGIAPYTWTVVSGSVPAGLSLDGSTTQTTALSGTPTTLGTSTFTLKVTDSSSGVQTITQTVVVGPQSACVLGGQYAYLFTGFKNGLPVVRAGNFNIATDGTILGEDDYKDATLSRIDEQLSDGTCTTVSQNRGEVQLVSPFGVEQFDFGVRAALDAGQFQENDGTPVVGTAQFLKQDTTKFSLAAIAGDFAFGMVGDSGKGERLVVVGRLTLGATGAITAGQADSNSILAAPGAALTGSFAAPDSSGRGTATLVVGGLTLPIAYYIVDENTIYVVSDDASTTAPRLAGRMSSQTGAGSFSATSLAGPVVLSMFGSQVIQSLPQATVSVGLMRGGVNGAVTVGLDFVDPTLTIDENNTTAAPYTVAANGRGTLTLDNTTSAPRKFVLYLWGPGNGYLVEPASPVGTFGTLDAQLGSPYSNFHPTYFLGGSVFNSSSSPITSVPELFFDDGAMSGNLTGSYAIDPVTGQVLATVTRNILGGTGLIGYVISPTRMVLIGNGVNSVNSTLVWLMSY